LGVGIIGEGMFERKNVRKEFLDWTLSMPWRNPFSVTLTYKQAILANNNYIKLDSIAASKNNRYFLNILTRAALGKSAARYGKTLMSVGVFEGDEGVRLHAHFCIDKPPHLSDEGFHGLIISSWNRTLFGYMEVDVKPCTDLHGWLQYIAKYRTKSDYSDAIDWMNVHSGCRV
jgi:hypothetical protein